MNKFPLITKLGLSIETKIVANYDQTEKLEISSVSASDLEAILQNASLIYFTDTSNGRQNFNLTKGSVHTHAGLLLMQSKIFVCENHEPAFHDEFTECVHCGKKMKRGYTTED